MVSRHARRRAKLYAIPESVIKQLIETTQLIDGANEIIRYVPGVTFPLKIVVLKENQTITVITNYPLKKRINYESSL